MTTVQNAAGVRLGSLGRKASTSSYTLVVETKTLFNVTGIVLVTAIVGYVDTAITVANTVKLQANPTVGTTANLCAATDIGTTDTPAGDLLTVGGAPGDPMMFGIGAVPRYASSTATLAAGGAGDGLYIAAGTIEQVTATGADGAITWHLCYIPITDTGNVSAAF